MEVKVISATMDPLTACSLAAGCCYGKDNFSESRLVHCLNSGHLSVFEHASATWKVEGISRACSHQLVRHRLASYSQQSQRYCKVDVDDYDWYVIPPSLEGDVELSMYHDTMAKIASEYQHLLGKGGLKPEDARYVLPNACKTDIFVSMNFREFMHFLNERYTKQTQWEIRELAQKMGRALSLHGTQWGPLLSMYEECYGKKLWDAAGWS